MYILFYIQCFHLNHRRTEITVTIGRAKQHYGRQSPSIYKQSRVRLIVGKACELENLEPGFDQKNNQPVVPNSYILNTGAMKTQIQSNKRTQ